MAPCHCAFPGVQICGLRHAAKPRATGPKVYVQFGTVVRFGCPTATRLRFLVVMRRTKWALQQCYLTAYLARPN